MQKTQTEIICTVGPASSRTRIMRAMFKAGMSMIRINMSHASPRDMSYFTIRAHRISPRLKVMADLPGPKIRIGDIPPRAVRPGMRIVLTSDQTRQMARIPINYPKLPSLLSPGDRITTDDGRVGLLVKKIRGNHIHCEVQYGWTIKPRRGVNVPFVDEQFPLITEHDQELIPKVIPKGPSVVATSFVRNVANVQAVRDAIDAAGGKKVKLIAKIETPEAVHDIRKILKSDATDGVMVARGDLAYEGDRSLLLLYALRIIVEAKRVGKPVIMATQMLSSMEHSWVPTRAEIFDVSLAVTMGLDGVMTSGETARGKHPVEVVEVMKELVEAAEKNKSELQRLLKRIL